MLAALLITVSLAAPTTLTDHGSRAHRPVAVQQHDDQRGETRLAQSSSSAGIDPNAPDHEASFVEKYLSYQLAPTALPQVKDGLVMSHVLGYLLYPICGGLWGPIVAIDGAEFSGDVVLTWFLSSIIWSVVLVAVSTVTAGIGLLGIFAIPYFQTTATLNAIDRQLKEKGYKPEPKKPKNDTTTPPTSPDTPPPSYAY